MNYSRRRFLSVAASGVGLTVILGACGSDSDDAEPTVTRVTVDGAPATVDPAASPVATEPGEPAASPAPGGETPSVGSGASAEVHMFDLGFKPNAITIPAGTDVSINLTNDGVMPHDFSIDDVVTSALLDPGKSESVTLNLAAGTYDFHCTVPGHKEAGMVGTVTVE